MTHPAHKFRRALTRLRLYFNPPPPSRPDPDLVSGLERESQPFAPTLTIVDKDLAAWSTRPWSQRNITLSEWMAWRASVRGYDSEVDQAVAERDCADSLAIKRDIEKAGRPTSFTRKLRAVP